MSRTRLTKTVWLALAKTAGPLRATRLSAPVFIAVAGAAFALSLLESRDAISKPKLSYGCTMSQIQNAANSTAAGRQCSKQQDDSVINNTTFIVFVCTSDGVYCCPENATGANQCTKVSGIRSSRLQNLQAIIARGSLRRLQIAPTTTTPAVTP